MKKILLFSFFLIGISLHGQEVSYFVKKIRTAGLLYQWNENQIKEDEKSGLITGVNNDDQNLYLIFQINNQNDLLQILEYGLSINIKSKKKPKVNARIDYPLADESIVENDSVLANLDKIIAAKTGGEFKGFESTKGYMLLEESELIKISFAHQPENNSILNYEARIPLVELYAKPIDLDEIVNSKISITFRINSSLTTEEGNLKTGSGGVVGRNISADGRSMGYSGNGVATRASGNLNVGKSMQRNLKSTTPKDNYETITSKSITVDYRIR